jgi:hypothetical protein
VFIKIYMLSWLVYPSLSVSLSLLLLPIWSIGHPWNASFPFSFLILRQSVGQLGRGISPSQDRYLNGTTQTQNKRRQTSTPWVGFEPTIPEFERENTVDLCMLLVLLGHELVEMLVCLEVQRIGYKQRIRHTRFEDRTAARNEEFIFKMYRRVVLWKSTDVAKEHLASIFVLEE